MATFRVSGFGFRGYPNGAALRYFLARRLAREEGLRVEGVGFGGAWPAKRAFGAQGVGFRV